MIDTKSLILLKFLVIVDIHVLCIQFPERFFVKTGFIFFPLILKGVKFNHCFP